MLIARPISHTRIQYMNYLEIFSFYLDLSIIHLLVLVGVELPLCLIVTPSYNPITCFWESS